MGTVNIGSQTVMWRYRTPLVGQDLAMMQDGILQPGVYRGLVATRFNDTIVNVAPGVAVLRDSASAGASSGAVVKIEFAAPVTVTPTYPARYLVARFTWNDLVDNYADLVATSDPESTDLVLAEIHYGTVGETHPIESVDASVRVLGSLPVLQSIWDNLRPQVASPYHRTVYIHPGKALVNGNTVEYAGGTFTFAPAASDRTDIVGLDSTGALSVVTGVSGSQLPPNASIVPICLARITSATEVFYAEDIEDVRPFLAAGASGTVSFADLANGYDNEYGTTAPNQLTDVEVTVSGRDALVQVVPQANLTNFLCYHVQVSLDQLTWYPPSPAGYDPARPGASAVFWSPGIELKNLPNRELSAGIFGPEVYWVRVRQVTTANQTGPWSDAVSFTTYPISAQDLGEGIITDLNIASTSLVARAASNFNVRNDRIATVPAAPTVPSDGSALDFTDNFDLSINLSFEWSFEATGEAADIDGFIVHVYLGASPDDHVFGTDPSVESLYYLAPDRRAFIMYGAPKDRYYSFGVQAYRVVDPDIDASCMLRSAIVKPSLSTERPFNPLVESPFSGDIGSTVSGNSALTVTDTTPPDATSAVASSANNADGSITVSWSGFTDAETGILGFKLWRRSSGRTVLVKELLAGATSYVDSALTLGVSYEYSVAAYDRNGNESQATAFTAPRMAQTSGLPVAPSYVVATPGLGVVEVSFSKSTAPGFHHYLVMRSLDGGASYPTSGMVSSRLNVVRDYGVTGPNASVRYKVRTIYADGSVSADSDVVALSSGMYTPASGVAPAAIPSANYTQVSNLNGTVSLSWTAVAAAAFYRVFRQRQGESVWILQATLPSTDLSFIDSEVAAGSSYRYAVRAVSATGMPNTGDFTDSLTEYGLVVDNDPPAVPVFTVNPLVGAVRLSWSSDRRPGTIYRVYRCTGPWLDGLAVLLDDYRCDGEGYMAYTDNLGVDTPANFSYKIRTEDTAGNVSGFAATSISVTSSVVPEFPADTDLALYWSFDDAGAVTSDLVTDLSLNGYHGRLRLGGSWVPGKSGSMLTFTGNGYVETEDTHEADVAGATALTYSFFALSQSADRCIFNHGEDDMAGCRLFVIANGGGRLRLFNYNGIDGAETFFEVLFPAGTFTESLLPYMLVVDNANLKVVLYKNGDYAGAYMLPGQMLPPFGTLAKLTVAADEDGLNRLIGSIDEFRIYRKALLPQHARGLAQYVTSGALGSLVAIGTQKYRSSEAPSFQPVPISANVATAESGFMTVELNWAAYTQGNIPANFLTLFWTSCASPLIPPYTYPGDPSFQSQSITVPVNVGSAGRHVFESLSPERAYSFGIAAGRNTENGIVYTNLRVLDLEGNPVWRNVNTPAHPNYVGTVNGVAADQLISASQLAGVTAGLCAVHFGTDAMPDGSLGKDGDIYHNTATSAEWVKTGGTWIIANRGAVDVRITGGVPMLYYSNTGTLLSALGEYTVVCRRNGIVATPESHSWQAHGSLAGSATTPGFTPTDAGLSTTTPTYVSVTVVIDGITYVDIFPVAVSRTGDTGAQGPAGPGVITYTATGTATYSAPSTIAKPTGTDAWNSTCHSGQYLPYCMLSFRAGVLAEMFRMGLETPGGTLLAFRIDANGNWYVEGVASVTHGHSIVVTTANIFLMTYDGRTVRCYVDGVLVAEQVYAGLTFRAHTAWYSVGAIALDVVFSQIGTKGNSGIGLGIRVNYSEFATVNSGECYVHGFDEHGIPADLDGYLYFDNAPLLVRRGMVNTNVAGKFYIVARIADGYIGSARYDYSTSTARLLAAGTGEPIGVSVGTVLDAALYAVIGTFENDTTENTVRAYIYPTARRFRDVFTDAFAEIFFRPGSAAATQAEVDSLITALGVTTLDFLAARNAFITNLVGSSAFIGRITSNHLRVTAKKYINTFSESADGMAGWTLGAGASIIETLDPPTTGVTKRVLQLVAPNDSGYTDAFEVLPSDLLEFSFGLQSPNYVSGSGIFVGLTTAQTFTRYLWNFTTRAWVFVSTVTNQYFVSNYLHTYYRGFKTYILGSDVDIADVPAPVEADNAGVSQTNIPVSCLKLANGNTTAAVRFGYDSQTVGTIFLLFHPHITSIGSGKIIADNIEAGAIKTTHLSAGAVTAGTIAADAVTAGAIDTGAVTADSISSKCITTDHLDVAQVTADSAFVGSLFASEAAFGAVKARNIDTTDLFSKLIEIAPGGAIYSGYSPEGELLAGAGFHLSSSGKFKASSAEITGTLKTGAQASVNARLAVRDESGIRTTEFFGVGKNDLSAVTEGTEEGRYNVSIHSLGTSYALGSVGPAGGRIVYADQANGLYLELAPVDISASYAWSNVTGTTVDGTSTKVGTGLANSNLITAQAGHTSSAAALCRAYSLGGFSDWHLPSDMDLYMVYFACLVTSGLRTTLGISDAYYQTSSQYSADRAYVRNPYTCASAAALKSAGYRVRPVRAFFSTDNFVWRRDTWNGSSWVNGTYTATPQPCRASPAESLGATSGISVVFSSARGHTVGEYWSMVQGSMYGLSIMDGGGVEYVKASNGNLLVRDTGGTQRRTVGMGITEATVGASVIYKFDNGPVITISSTAPATANNGDIWIRI